MQTKLDVVGLTNVRLVCGGVGEGKLEPETFDRALLVTVLGEIRDRKAAFAETCRSLTPGGTLSVTETLPDPHYQSPSTIRRIASEVGFEECGYFGTFPAFTIHLRKPEVVVAGQSCCAKTTLNNPDFDKVIAPQ